MSERDRKETETEDFESDEVEAHLKKAPGAAAALNDDEGDDVEAHIKAGKLDK